MNFIFISPNFPVRYFKWVEALSGHGINVLGIGDSPYYDVHPRLSKALKEYYFVSDLSDYPKMLEACRYYEMKYGKIDFIESDNEWWLESDARLRLDMGVNSGFHPADMHRIKAKSAMKEAFRSAGVKTMRYVLADGPEDLDKVLTFAKEVNYPLFAKPDVGVGANDSFSLNNEEEVRKFLAKKLPETYIVEEKIDGIIVSFDGICDSKSEVVFATSDHFMTPIADVVNEDTDYYYYNNPFDLPFHDIDGKAFLETGKRVVKSFGIRDRFFHIEFFVLNKDKEGFAKANEFVALECNMRPPGGYTPDLIDYANSVSCYEIYADVICYDQNRQDMGKEKYYAFAAARKDVISYRHCEQEILTRYKNEICMHGRYPAHMAKAMGDTYYYGRFKDFEKGKEFAAFVAERA